MSERQSSSRARRIGRRAFLGTVPAVVAAGVAAPTLSGRLRHGRQGRPPGPPDSRPRRVGFGVDALKGAEKVFGVDFTDAEEEMALRGVSRNLDSYERCASSTSRSTPSRRSRSRPTCRANAQARRHAGRETAEARRARSRARRTSRTSRSCR